MTIAKIALILAGGVSLSGYLTPTQAWLLGVVISLSLGNPYSQQTQKWAQKLLKISVVGLGAGMSLKTIGVLGGQTLVMIIASISFTFALGFLINRWLKVDSGLALLLTSGTAICGGSAIAAVASVTKAKPFQISGAIGVVFLFNSLALILFPELGRLMEMGQREFGIWAALAIHDTSSVVGASLAYGAEALEVGTTAKLIRAIGIIPMALLISLFAKNEEGGKGAIKIPWFIVGFVLMAAIVTLFPVLEPLGLVVKGEAKRLLVLTLFLIGGNLSRKNFQDIGIKPMIYGLCLWIVIAVLSLQMIRWGWV